MAKCIRCGGGGAKRPCPALAGDLCPRCCGQHQRREIHCPEGCRFLRQGGGEDGYGTVLPKLLDFAMSSEVRARPALARLTGPKKTLGDWEQPLVLAHLAYGYADANGDRSIDVFLRERQRELKATEIEALEALQKTAWPSLFEVQKVEVDVGIHFLDLVTRELVFVREKSGTHYLKKFDVMLGWMVQLGDHLEMTGAGVGVPRGHLEPVKKALLKEMRRLRQGAEVPDRVLLRQAVVVAQHVLREAIESWRPPKMVTMDGEDLVFCEALFDVSDLAAVRSKLQAHPDMDAEEDSFVWVDRKGRKQLGGGPLHLGGVTFARGRMRLETKSRERLERGKQLLGEYLAGVARHRMDSIKDLNVAMEELARRPEREPDDELPDDVQAQLLGPILQKHIAQWIDEHLPALNGKTPRQAVKTKTGRDKVLAMLKDQENSMQRQPGGALVDFSAVYLELGLTQDR
jgi:hypothetical protein